MRWLSSVKTVRNVDKWVFTKWTSDKCLRKINLRCGRLSRLYSHKHFAKYSAPVVCQPWNLGYLVPKNKNKKQLLVQHDALLNICFDRILDNSFNYKNHLTIHPELNWLERCRIFPTHTPLPAPESNGLVSLAKSVMGNYYCGKSYLSLESSFYILGNMSKVILPSA